MGAVADAATRRPLAGARVFASSPSLQAEQVAVADSSGRFLLSLLPPGRYRLSAELEGYRPAERADVVLRVGQTLRADLALVPETVELPEQVVRTAPPVVDVGTAETGAVLSREVLASVPLGRDVQSATLVAPTARPDTYGTSFTGAASNENAYLLDGFSVSDPGYGVLGTNLLTNFVEEVDVKTGSFLPEYGRSTSGLVNVVTKSGSNDFHGSVFANASPGLLAATGKTVSRAGEAIARVPNKDESYQADFGVELGGPLLADRLWFYFGFAPVLRVDTDRRVVGHLTLDPSTGEARRDADGTPVVTPFASRSIYDSATNRQLVAKLTWLAAENHTLTASYVSSPLSRSYWAAVNGTPSAGERSFDRDAHDLLGRWAGKFAGQRLLAEAQVGWHHQSLVDEPRVVGGVDQRRFPNVTWNGVHPLYGFEPYAACQPTLDAAGQVAFDPCPVGQYATGGYPYIADQRFDRLGARAALTGLFPAWGHHAVKAGVDLERSTYANVRSYGGGSLFQYFEPVFLDVAYGRGDGGQTRIADATQSTDSVGWTNAYFLQDSWAVLDAVTLNAGLRWETQDLRAESQPGRPGLHIGDNLAPRVQAVWDFTGQGRGKLFGSWGRFYEAIPLDIADRALGNETLVLTYRDSASCALPGAAQPGARATFDPRGCAAIPNAFGPVTYYQISTGNVPIAPGLKGQYVDEWGGGVEYELLQDLSVGVTYQGRRLGNVVEDMSADGRQFFIANPGRTAPFGYVDPTTGLPATFDQSRVPVVDPRTNRAFTVAFPSPERRYDAVTFELRKSFSRRWLAAASYTYSSLRGNYPGLSRPETGQIDPNVSAEFDLAQLLANRTGPLPGDSPHQVKIYGAYAFPLGRRLGARLSGAFQAASGTPVNLLGAYPSYGPGQPYLLPRGSAGRLPMTTQLDLGGALEYALAPPYTLKMTVDVFNVLNQQTALRVDEVWTFDAVMPISGSCRSRSAAGAADPVAEALRDCPDLAYLRTLDGRPATINRNFGRPIRANAALGFYTPPAYQLPLAVRVGLALTF